MFLNLLIREFKDLKTILIRSLCSFSLCKIINNSPIRECLLNIFISKEDNQITIRVGLSSYTVREDDLFLARLVDSLNLAVMAHNLFNDLLVLTGFLVVFVTEFE